MYFFHVDGKYAAVFLILHVLLLPTTRSVKKRIDGEKQLITHNIVESQNSFLFCTPTITDLESHLLYLTEKREHIQPFIIIIGDYTEPKEILLYVFR